MTKKAQSQKKLVFVARNLTIKDIVKHMRSSWKSIETELADKTEVKRLEKLVEEADLRIKDFYWLYCEKKAIEKARREKMEELETNNAVAGIALDINETETKEEAAKRAASMAALSEALRKEQLAK